MKCIQHNLITFVLTVYHVKLTQSTALGQERLHRSRLQSLTTHERNPIAKKIWLSIHPRNFGSHVTVRPSVRTRRKPDEVSHFQDSVGACIVIFHIHALVN